jgi:hypothetical protein
MADLDDIKVKDPTTLTDEEKGVLKDSWDSLTDDEKGTFKDVNPPSVPETFGFKSQEEFDKAVTERTEKILADKETARLEEERKKLLPPEEDFFPPNFQAKDWNEAARIMFPKFKEKIFKEQEMTTKQRQEQIDKINQEFDKEIESIVVSNPELPKKGTPERKDWETELAKVGMEYPVRNMTQAYNIWKALKGGKSEEPVSNRQKDLASKIGRSGGEGTVVKERSHKELSGRSMDDLIEEDLAKLGVKD